MTLAVLGAPSAGVAAVLLALQVLQRWLDEPPLWTRQRVLGTAEVTQDRRLSGAR
jgi:hypothetical protein